MEYRGIDIFCTIIDNFGDAGVVYRLAKELKKTDNDITIDSRIEDIGTNLNYWGIGFSLIAIFTGIAVFLENKNYADSAKKEAKAAAQQELKDWVDSKAEKEFEILIDNAKLSNKSNITYYLSYYFLD